MCWGVSRTPPIGLSWRKSLRAQGFGAGSLSGSDLRLQRLRVFSSIAGLKLQLMEVSVRGHVTLRAIRLLWRWMQSAVRLPQHDGSPQQVYLELPASLMPNLMHWSMFGRW